MKVLIIFGLIYATAAQDCGQTSFTLVPKSASTYIVGGQDANPGDFPWQVGIIEDDFLICGGTYILGTDGSVKVVTAAHCITKNANRYAAVFGMHETTDSSNRWKAQAISVKNHRSYDSNTMANDISIMSFGVMPSYPNLTDTFAVPACLPTKDYVNYERAIVSGWGTTSEGGSSSTTLKYVEKPILDRQYCNTQTGNAGDIDTTMMCAGNAGKDACQGDSGGPLVAYRNNKWELVGVVSWGYGCGRDNFPGVYADTWALQAWIKNNS